MSVPMIARKEMKYRTRRLLPGDDFRVKNEREAKVLVHLKRADRVNNPDPRVALDDARAKVGMPAKSAASDDIKALRDAYFAKTGKRAFNGWSADQLREKLAAE